MADIQFIPGQLPPPACYSTEQERFEAYTAAITPILSGGIQWEASQVAPTNLTLYWMQLDANNRPLTIRKYSAADAKWAVVLAIPFHAVGVGGTGDAILITNTPAFSAALAYYPGRRFTFVSPGTAGGPVTINIDGLGIKSITKHGELLEAGDIVGGQIVDIIYNAAGTSFELQTPSPAFLLDPIKITDEIRTVTAGVPAEGAQVGIPHGCVTKTGVPRIPKAYWVRLRCMTDQSGYLQNDEVDIKSPLQRVETPNREPLFNYSANSTVVTVMTRLHQGGGGGMVIQSKADPNILEIFVPSNWNIVVHVF